MASVFAIKPVPFNVFWHLAKRLFRHYLTEGTRPT